MIVTRGEKPTSGFELEIDRMILEEKEGRSNLVLSLIHISRDFLFLWAEAEGIF